MRKKVQFVAGVINLLIIGVLGFTLYAQWVLPDSYNLIQGENIQFPFKVNQQVTQALASNSTQKVGSSYQLDVELVGSIPVKSVEINIVDRKNVCISGAPFGIKMFTEGLMVVGMSHVSTDGDRINPSREAGVEIGDIIEKINGIKLTSNKQLGAVVESSNGTPIKLLIRRGNEHIEKNITPVKSVGDGAYRIGIWVRDSSAGIGTMTYYDKNSGMFTGLGHAVCDIDTGEIMPLHSGEAVPAQIVGLSKGEKGEPGELKGKFDSQQPLGTLTGNTQTGIYGKLSGDIHIGQEVPMAFAHEVTEGYATIFTTIDGNVPTEYTAEIEKVDFKDKNKTQNMIVHITDPRLLETTGGIVQGMSGSPILQNGMLIGSVTHVFVNDPTRGFGIFAENIDATYSQEVMNIAS